ncbi:hypothetical protein HK44_000010 [Pseudomonas fluorescens HK44]|uniref:Uncharacterized protein n=1 Tax=Pseudomonas fluorescens HK44 TaxID=1042209 RepID=A0A010S8F7_PSEFL|nr:hypothetical protein HK44_000010 [Pseudomonas fluorescens HK44]
MNDQVDIVPAVDSYQTAGGNFAFLTSAHYQFS